MSRSFWAFWRSGCGGSPEAGALARASWVAAAALAAGCAGLPDAQRAVRPADVAGEGGDSGYWEFYRRGFRDLPKPDAAAVRRLGLSRVYPCPAAQLWGACLDVMGQYDAVAYLLPGERVAVFAHGRAAPKRYADTLLAVQVEPRGDAGSAVCVAWVAPKTGSLQEVPPLPAGFQARDMQKADAETARRWAAAIVTQGFLGQLSVQALYKDRWRERFKF